MVIRGGCLCGKVGYEVSGELTGASHCHCSQCRRQHGAAFATYADCKVEDFRWTHGADLVKSYETAEGVGWSFCSECGSSLAATDQGKIFAVTLGSVEGDPGIRPASHIFVGSKSSWYNISDNLPQHDEWPPENT